MHHARSFAVVLNIASGVYSSVCFFADKAVELMRVSTRSSVEPSAMFFRRASSPFYLSCFYSIYSLLLIFCYLCCDALVFVPVISLAALYCLGHILLPVVCPLVGPARRSRLLKCCCAVASAAVVGALPHVDFRDDHGFNYC